MNPTPEQLTNQSRPRLTTRLIQYALSVSCLAAAAAWVNYLIAPPAPEAPPEEAPAAVPPKPDNSLHFNPANCKPGHGEFVYAALGRSVLRIPYRTQLFLQPYAKDDRDWAKLPLAPDPAEPEGCYGNPTRVLFMYYPIPSLTIPATADQPSRTVDPRRFELITNMGRNYYMQELYEDMFEKGKANKKGNYDCTPHTPDLIGCIPRTNPTAGVYQARPERYQAPAQRPFTIECLDYNWRCGVNYRTVGDINIDYIFNFQQLPLEHVIAFDKYAREHVIQLVVQDYAWAANPAVKQTASNSVINK
ncbi:hypothetical protein HNQ59_001510 [Chitinivorax tropicus]|uniref:Uncharacterized protein n=1 Tax=Chitinivorax tropicus TaxID=714531 RepID=A0A840ML49_9PROT|nr:hypothetical protein [Chitinivorax tropicus]MBB5018225.1 hypothetical protein [Chitinivorax tropicus]